MKFGGKILIHRAAERGFANHGWLESAHSFSFATFHDRNRMNFGALRVLNDDWIEPGTGFDTHSHRNMEIISVPLSGSLRHRDSQGHEFTLAAGDIQVMSAGSGIEHSEYNASEKDRTNLLQIWVIPNRKETPPSYRQKHFAPEGRQNRFQLIVSPDGREESLPVLQDAFLSLASLPAESELKYRTTKPCQGVYVFLIAGELSAEGQKFSARDAFGISEHKWISLRAHAPSELLLIEVPLQTL
jgi:quercetin 2,3-dioxygenase